MSKVALVTLGGASINLATIKSFKIKSDDKSNVLTIEHKARVEYILHPETGKYEKHIFNETTDIEYKNWDVADAYRNEWVEIWEYYLLNETE